MIIIKIEEKKLIKKIIFVITIIIVITFILIKLYVIFVTNDTRYKEIYSSMGNALSSKYITDSNEEAIIEYREKDFAINLYDSEDYIKVVQKRAFSWIVIDNYKNVNGTVIRSVKINDNVYVYGKITIENIDSIKLKSSIISPEIIDSEIFIEPIDYFIIKDETELNNHKILFVFKLKYEKHKYPRDYNLLLFDEGYDLITADIWENTGYSLTQYSDSNNEQTKYIDFNNKSYESFNNLFLDVFNDAHLQNKREYFAFSEINGMDMIDCIKIKKLSSKKYSVNINPEIVYINEYSEYIYIFKFRGKFIMREGNIIKNICSLKNNYNDEFYLDNITEISSFIIEPSENIKNLFNMIESIKDNN